MRRHGLTVGLMRRLYTFSYLRNGGGFQADVRQSIKSTSPLIAPTVRPDETATKLTLNIKKNIYRNYVFKKHWGRNGIDFLDVPAPVFIFLVFLGKVGARKVGARLTTYQFEDFLH